MKKPPIEYIRHGVQITLAIFLLYIGWQFYQFVMYYEGQVSTLSSRPPSVEGFLPISALMSLRLWLGSGMLDPIHPAGLVIFIAVLLSAFLVRKGFCGWLCPIGALSEALAIIGEKIGVQLAMPKALDVILKAIKYLLLGFFVKIIFLDMPVQAVYLFLQNDYNKISDVKMLKFFLNLSGAGLAVLVILVVASVFFKHFWCRYLCPYGALLGVLALASPVAVKRQQSYCIDCKKCDQACPNALRVSNMKRVYSPECVGCLNCVDVCPKEKALEIRLGKWSISSRVFGAMVMAIFFGIILWAKTYGYWETSITLEEYSKLIPLSRFLGH